MNFCHISFVLNVQAINISINRKYDSKSKNPDFYNIFIFDFSHQYTTYLISYFSLFKSTPQTNLIKVINSFIGVTARYIRSEFPYLKKFLLGDAFWTPSYFLATTGQLVKCFESLCRITGR